MSQGIIQKLTGEFTDDSLPRYYPKDAMLNKGSMFMFDFGKIDCYPSQLAALVNGGVFKNLVDGGADATIALATAGMSYANGGVNFTGAAANAINLGGGYNLSTIGCDFVLNVWFKLPTGRINTGFQGLIGRGRSGTANTVMASLDLGNATLAAPYATTGNSAGTRTLSPSNQLVLDTVYLLSMSLQNGVMKIYKNGVPHATTLTGITKPINDPVAPHNVWLMGKFGDYTQFSGIMYRTSLENLTASGKMADEQVALEYAKNASRFV